MLAAVAAFTESTSLRMGMLRNWLAYRAISSGNPVASRPTRIAIGPLRSAWESDAGLLRSAATMRTRTAKKGQGLFRVEAANEGKPEDGSRRRAHSFGIERAYRLLQSQERRSGKRQSGAHHRAQVAGILEAASYDQQAAWRRPQLAPMYRRGVPPMPRCPAATAFARHSQTTGQGPESIPLQTADD